MIEIKQLQDALDEQIDIARQHQRTIDDKRNNDDSSVAVLMEAVKNRDFHIADLERQFANAKILASTQPESADQQRMHSLENELHHMQRVLGTREAEIDELRNEMPQIKFEMGQLLSEREQMLTGPLL